MDERTKQHIKAKCKKLEELDKIENAIKILSGKGAWEECHIELSLLFKNPIEGTSYTSKKEIPDSIKEYLLHDLKDEKKEIEDELENE